MTSKQKSLYWREWAAVHRTDPARDRHDLHIRALGHDASMLRLTNAQFDRVLAEFRSISRPADLDAQVRALNQPQTRALHTIERLTEELATVLPLPLGEGRGEGSSAQSSAEEYVLSICRDRFHATTILTLDAHDLQQLCMTLANRLRALRSRQRSPAVASAEAGQPALEPALATATDDANPF